MQWAQSVEGNLFVLLSSECNPGNIETNKKRK